MDLGKITQHQRCLLPHGTALKRLEEVRSEVWSDPLIQYIGTTAHFPRSQENKGETAVLNWILTLVSCLAILSTPKLLH
jgi:hypothetical protein